MLRSARERNILEEIRAPAGYTEDTIKEQTNQTKTHRKELHLMLFTLFSITIIAAEMYFTRGDCTGCADPEEAYDYR